MKSLAIFAALAVVTASASTPIKLVANKPTWSGQRGQCQAIGKDLCTLAEYCPGGEGSVPYGGSESVDSWAPVLEPAGDFVQVGTGQSCKSHKSQTGSIPAWGSVNDVYGTELLCCQVVTPLFSSLLVLKRFSGTSLGASTSHSAAHAIEKQFCEAKGGRLPTLSEMCAGTGSGGTATLGCAGTIHDSSNWMPYGTNGDSWLRMGCGLPTSYICKDHMAMFGTPNWSAGDVYGDEIDCMVPPPLVLKRFSGTSLGASTSHSAAHAIEKQFCEAKGGRLPTLSEMCTGTGSGGTATLGCAGTIHDSSNWMPYGTNGDSWLSMGCSSPTYICKDHMALAGTPNWGAGDVYGDEIDCMVPAPVPTKVPTKAPTDAPTKAPTDAPTKAPTDAPTKAPTDAPTKAPTDAPTKAPIKAPTKAPTGAPTAATVALGKAQALSAHADLLNSDPVSALSKYKHALSAFTTVLGVKDLLTQGMAHRVSKIAVANGGSPLSGLDANYPADAFAHQGSCPATVPAFANGVNGAKVVGKGPHGAHDENMSGSIVPVDCADGFTATPEGSYPLVFQRCDAVAGDTSKYEWKPYGTCDATSAPTKSPTDAPTKSPATYKKMANMACSGKNEMDAIFKANGERASTKDAITLDEAKALCNKYPACVSFERENGIWTQFSSSCKENTATSFGSYAITLYVKV
jgi:hypothetical protein